MKEPFFATCPKGLELLLEDELKSLGATFTKQTVAGVNFKGDMDVAYKACLWSRFANRILLPVSHTPITTGNDLYTAANKIKWYEHLDVDATFRVDFTGVYSEITNSHFGAQKIKDAIVDQFRNKFNRRPSVEKRNPMVRINAMLRKGYVTLSIDLSGESLHKRGYRVEGASAPLKENLAAALLHRANWPKLAQEGGSLVDPMCGTGTLLIEGVLIAADIAPGLLRKQFGFHGWKKYNEKLWQKLYEDALARAKQGKLTLHSTFHGFDIDDRAINQARACLARANLSHFVELDVKEIKYLTTHDIKKKFGLCITNPPYGDRLEEQENLLPLYRMLAYKLKENFLNWEAAIMTGNVEITKKIGLRAYKKYALFNGTIPCELLLFHIKPEWFVNKPNT